MTEAPYAFRRYLETVHHRDQRDPAATRAGGEIDIDESWSIVIRHEGPELIRTAARDLQDYFQVSMDVDLPVRRVADLAGDGPSPAIVLATVDQLPSVDGVPGQPRGFRILVERDRVTLCGRDARGAAQASYRLEDRLNLRGGPFLEPGEESRAPVFSPRMVHSGWGLDEFPDPYLNLIAHHGMDAILVFASDVHRTPDEHVNRTPGPNAQGRHNDFNAIVDRAERYGLDVYLYAYPHGKKPLHPDDPGAERFYEETYGALFRACPRAKGIILVGESVEFPSRDPRTSGRLRLDPDPAGLPASKPNPGWWPCEDYPAWVSLVSRVCRRYNPDAEVVFWTYNWGYAPEEERLRLIRSLPDGITLQATFEMFEPVHHDGVTNVCVDYTIASAGPGTYFASEAAAARERGLPLYTMANTGGLTWDFGVIPYQPVPQQWSRRHIALCRAQADWGLSGIMESHHFGWWPSIVSELAKASYWEPRAEPDETIDAIARRDFGAGAAQAVAAWAAWSDATGDYIPTNEDQYGPFRIGPAYPLALFANPRLPVSEFAMFGDMIVTTPYSPENNARRTKTAAAIRINAEIASLQRMRARWDEGIRLLEDAAAQAPPHKAERNRRMLTLGRYIPHAIQTTIHTKQWWQAKTRLLVEDDPERANALLDRLAEIGEAELANCEACIPVVEADSRLGWEPSMEYLGDADHIRWKIAHLRHALGVEIPAYRHSLRV